MANNSIEVDLIANDLMSPILSQIQTRAGIFAPLLSGAISGAFSGDPVVAFAKTAAGAFETVLQGVEKLNDAIQSAAQAQTEAIGNANSLASVTGLGFGVAQDAMQQMNVELAKVGRDLPGKAEDFIKAANMIAPSFADGFGQVTEKELPQFENRLIGLTKNLVLMGQQAKVSSEATAEFSKGFISGTRGWGELRQLDFGQKNPAFFKALEAEIKAQGKSTKDIQKMTAQQRLAILETVSSKSISGDAIKALQNSADGIAASMSDTWFSPMIGIFGVMRQIKSVGDRSVLDAYTGLLRTVQDFSSTLSDIAKKLGIAFDPMEVVVNAIDWLNDQILAVSQLFKGMNTAQLMKAFSFQGVLNGIWDGYHKFWKSVPWVKIGDWAGTLLGDGIMALAKALLNPQNWLNAIRNVLDFAIASLAILWGFIKGLVQSICDGLNNAMNDFVNGLGDWFRNAWQHLNPMAQGNIFQSAGNAIVNGVSQIGDTAKGAFGIKDQPNTAKPAGTTPAPQPIVPLGAPIAAPVFPIAAPKPQPPATQPQSNAQPQINVQVHANTNADPEQIAHHVSRKIAESYNAYRLNNAIA